MTSEEQLPAKAMKRRPFLALYLQGAFVLMGFINWLIDYIADDMVPPAGVGVTDTDTGTSYVVQDTDKGPVGRIETRRQDWTPDLGRHHEAQIRTLGDRFDEGDGPGGYDGPRWGWPF